MKIPQKQFAAGVSCCFAVLAVLFAAVMGLSVLPSSPSRSFAAAMLLFFFVIYCVILVFRPLFRTPEYTICAAVLGFCGLALRLSLFEFQSGDYVSFLSIWTQTMENMTVSQALSTPIGDYNMPYLYLILLISRLPFYDLYCIKLFSVLADLSMALAVGKLAALFTEKQSLILLSIAAGLFAPTTWLNSAYWGQCDSIYAALALWGLYFGLKKRGVWSMVFFGLAFSFKLQTIFLLPVLAFLLITEHISLKSILAFPAAFLAVMVPALLGGRTVADTLSIYIDQTKAYPYLSLNAPSFWSLINNSYYSLLGSAPTLLAIVMTLLLLFWYARKYQSLTPKLMLELSLILSLMIPWLLPKMHERYFYLAEVLSIVYAAAFPQRIPVSLILLFGGFLIYSAYLFGGVPILSLQLIAVIYGVTLIYLLLRCSQDCTADSMKIKEELFHGEH
ncbi:MAG: hypothetical protein PUC06_04285 [Oscillospiraceae bacterium]|nr:hypothetical protein [Oscillospiraceae bacterium]